MTEIELKIVNATALDLDKVYLIEIDRTKVAQAQIDTIRRALGKLGIRGLIVRSIGGDGIRVVEQPTMNPEPKETSHV
jgi:hypothetical protein